MKKNDITMFTDDEATVLNNSFDQGGLPGRVRSITLGAFLATAVVLGLLVFEVSAGGIAASAIVFVLIASFEKITYARTQMHSQAVIRKLVHRVEKLEGVPFTPDNSRPTDLATEKGKNAA